MEREVSTQPKIRVTPEEYLARERYAEIKSEYFDGEIFPMPGVHREHSSLVINLVAELRDQFLDRPCEVHGPELRVKVSPTGLYTYPDVIVVCGELQFDDDMDTLMNPQVLIEVLSESTESYDRGRKFAHYRTIDSLREYILVSQTEPRMERYARQDDGSWVYSEVTDPAGSMELVSIACRLPLARIYHKVDVERARERSKRPSSPPATTPR